MEQIAQPEVPWAQETDKPAEESERPAEAETDEPDIHPGWRSWSPRRCAEEKPPV